MANLHAHIPEGILPVGTNAYIAGGYAACPERADDIDVWVRCPTVDELDSFRQQLLSHLTEQHYAFDSLNDRREYKDDYGDYVGGVLKVARVQRPGERDIHIMVTNLQPIDLLDTFDISTHMVAFDGERCYRNPEKWSALTEDPIVWKMTPTTPDRLEKIRNRYADLRTNGKING